MSDSTTPPPRPADPAPTVLEALSARTGVAPKVLLRDEDSHAGGNSPLIDASGREAFVPRERRQYQVLGKIAQGGMGVVLKSHDGDLGRDVAMKVLLETHADRPEIVQRFVEEAQIGGQLQHPGIVPVYELGLMADERPFFTMKLVKGRTLAALFSERRGEAGERRRFLKIFEQVCETMAYAHSRKVVHRDLKPANIMVGAFGEVQVVDWGLGKVLGEGGVADERRAKDAAARTEVSIIETLRSSGSSIGTESLAGSVMGTPAYMAPEQARGDIDRVDERADVFGLGAILCEILTGRPPYIGEHDENIVVEAARALQDGARARLAASGADAGLIDLVERCLAPNAEVRPRHAGLLLEELSGWLSDQDQRARDAELAEARAAQERKARRLTLALAVTVVLAVVLGGGAWQWHASGVAERRASLVREVDALMAEARLLRGRGELVAALETAERGALLVEASADADAELVGQVDALVVQLGVEREQAEAEAEVEARRERFVVALESRLRDVTFQQGFWADTEYYLEQYLDVLEEYGFEFDGDLASEALALRELADQELLGQVFDDIARLILDSSGYGSTFRRFVELAMLVDPDPARRTVREAVLADDRGRFEALIASPDAYASWSPVTARTFMQAVIMLGHKPLNLRPMLFAVRGRHPDDAALAGSAALYELLHVPDGEGDPVFALDAAAAAYALRPDSSVTSAMLAKAQAMNGLGVQAIERLMRTVREFPDDRFARSTSIFGFVLRNLDPTRTPADVLRRAVEAMPDRSTLSSAPANNIAWSLLNALESTRADWLLSRELAVIALDGDDEEDGVIWNTIAVASWLLGDFETALPAIDESLRQSGGDFETDHLLRAVLVHELGLDEDVEQVLRGRSRASVPMTDRVEFVIRDRALELFGAEAVD